jgi:hypothetical protein
VCGSDGCGGSCGTCSGNTTCSNGQCLCTPNCNGTLCGSDGCGGTCTCAGGYTCFNAMCVQGDVLHFTVDDQCTVGQADFEFFDETSGGYYADATNNNMPWVLSNGQTQTYNLQCTPGNLICFGGSHTVNNDHWCVDVNNSDNLNRGGQCCATCANASTSITLTCPVCGDGICNGTETQATCCTDCGCAPSLTCVQNTCYATLTWSVVDQCARDVINYRFFDETANLLYDNAGQPWSVTNGNTDTRSLYCTPGDNICFGGQEATLLGYWGVDVDNTQTCTNCCVTCSTASVNPLGQLTCP